MQVFQIVEKALLLTKMSIEEYLAAKEELILTTSVAFLIRKMVRTIESCIALHLTLSVWPFYSDEFNPKNITNLGFFGHPLKIEGNETGIRFENIQYYKRFPQLIQNSNRENIANLKNLTREYPGFYRFGTNEKGAYFEIIGLGKEKIIGTNMMMR